MLFVLFLLIEELTIIWEEGCTAADAVVKDSLLDEDNDEKINRLVEEEVVKEFEANDFSPKFKEDVQNDLECLLTIQNLWKNINTDPKIKKLISILKKDKKQSKNYRRVLGNVLSNMELNHTRIFQF